LRQEAGRETPERNPPVLGRNKERKEGRKGGREGGREELHNTEDWHGQ